MKKILLCFLVSASLVACTTPTTTTETATATTSTVDKTELETKLKGIEASWNLSQLDKDHGLKLLEEIIADDFNAPCILAHNNIDDTVIIVPVIFPQNTFQDNVDVNIPGLKNGLSYYFRYMQMGRMDTVQVDGSLAHASVIPYGESAAPVIKEGRYNADKTFDLTFTIKAINLTKIFIDSVLLKDDLTKVFDNTNGIKIISVTSSGGLIRNSNYDGIINTDLVTISSSLDSSKVDSVLLRINVPSTISGNFQNTVIGLVPTANGILTTLSTDPTRIVSTNDTVRKPTLFVIPKIPLNIPEGFSPNNDGIDDTWIIRRPMGTKVSVWVINRWGNEVYKNLNYNNDWRGKGIANILGEDLPEGTYYYIVHGTDVNGKLQKLAGSLTIKR